MPNSTHGLVMEILEHIDSFCRVMKEEMLGLYLMFIWWKRYDGRYMGGIPVSCQLDITTLGLNLSLIVEKMDLGFIDEASSSLFVCDVQEKFRPAMQNFSNILENIQKLILGCKVLGLPLVVTEQYPKGLGSTVAEIDISHAVQKIEKTKFSMVVPAVEEILPQICEGNMKTVILCGIETHVCVEQTAMDLRSKGYSVHVVADCTTSRSIEDRNLAFQRLQQIGCFITTSECILFKLLKDKNHSCFKEIASLVKIPSGDTGLAKL